jgi:anti-sigma factor RsiW
MGAERRLRGTLMKALALVGLHPWLTCRQCVESVTELLEDELSPRARGRVLAHLERCPDCPRYLHQIEVTIALARAINPGPVSPDARAALLDAFRDRHRSPDEET